MQVPSVGKQFATANLKKKNFICLSEDEFLQAVLSAFHCWEPKERQSTCVRLIAGMATHEVFFKQATESEESDEPKKVAIVWNNGNTFDVEGVKFG